MDAKLILNFIQKAFKLRNMRRALSILSNSYLGPDCRFKGPRSKLLQLCRASNKAAVGATIYQ